MTDLVLGGGTLVDGTGAPPRAADVLIAGGRVEAVIERVAEPGVEPGAAPGVPRLDVSGRVVCPGFVDIHTHSDLTLLSNPLAHSKVRQGVTTEVVGNCGLGVAPLGSDVDPAALRQAVAYLDLDPAVGITWRTVAEYLDTLAAARPSLHVGTLAGHVPVRTAVLGFDDRPASPAEVTAMADVLAGALRDGALGLSTGLMYPPLRTARTDELVALGEVVAEHGGVFAWHLRDYGDDLLASATEAVLIARRAGCRTQISHLCSVGERNWGRVSEVLAMLDAEGVETGTDIGVDIYPYLAGNAPLSQLLPEWVTDAGPSVIPERLADPVVRQRIAAAWAHNAVPWTEITVASGADAAVLGRTVADLATDRPAVDVVLDLVATHGNGVFMTAGGRSPEDLRAVLDHDRAVVASDGLALDPDGPTGRGFPHPRSYGTFPRVLARTSGTALATAVHKATSAPARRVGLTDRGEVRAGQLADLVVLDMERLADRATFLHPQLFPAGVEHVLVAGTMVVENGSHTGSRPGDVVRRAPTK